MSPESGIGRGVVYWEFPFTLGKLVESLFTAKRQTLSREGLDMLVHSLGDYVLAALTPSKLQKKCSGTRDVQQHLVSRISPIWPSH